MVVSCGNRVSLVLSECSIGSKISASSITKLI